MAIKLNAATGGGSVALDAPNATTSNADVVLTLPVDDGTSGQYLQTNGSGTLSWQTVPNNGFESYAIICDQKNSTTDGGAFTQGDWRTRDLNTEISDADGIVSISSNQFTLGAGSYLIRWSAPAFDVSRHIARLYDITGGALVARGSAESSNTTSPTTCRSMGAARVTITANNVYEIQHRCSSTKTNNGLGVASDFDNNVYTIVEIYKEG